MEAHPWGSGRERETRTSPRQLWCVKALPRHVGLSTCMLNAIANRQKLVHSPQWDQMRSISHTDLTQSQTSHCLLRYNKFVLSLIPSV